MQNQTQKPKYEITKRNYVNTVLSKIKSFAYGNPDRITVNERERYLRLVKHYNFITE